MARYAAAPISYAINSQTPAIARDMIHVPKMMIMTLPFCLITDSSLTQCRFAMRKPRYMPNIVEKKTNASTVNTQSALTTSGALTKIMDAIMANAAGTPARIS